MKRILFVYHVTSVGGGSYCLLSILKAIDRTFFEPMVLLPQKGPLCDEIEKLGIEIVYFPSLVLYPYNKSLFKWRTLSTLRKIQRCQKGFAEVVRRMSPDIVYMNTMMLFPYLKTTKECGCKTLIHVREHWPLNEHKRQLEWARKCVYQYADKMIAINRYSASMFPQKEATIVYDWIDMDSRYKPMPLSEIFGEDMTGKKVLLYTGGMQRIKGAYEIVRSFVENVKDENCRLLVMGFTKELSGSGKKGKIKMLMYILGIPTYEYKVKMLARQDKRIVCIPGVYEIKDIVEQADCMVSYFTTPHANLAMAESIILGTPVIAANTDEAQEYSLNGKLATLFEMNNIRAYNDAIKSFVNGNNLESKMSEEDREKIRILFSKERNTGVLNNALKELIG